MPSIAETFINDISVIPAGVSNRTSILNGTVKLINSTIECALFYNIIKSVNDRQIAEGIKTQCKPLSDLLKTIAVFTTIRDMNQKEYWKLAEAAPIKFTSKLLSSVGTGLDFIQGLQTFDLISLGTISKGLGNIPGWHLIETAVAFTTVRDALTLGSVGLSLYSNVKVLINYTEKKELTAEKNAEELYTIRVNIISDVAICVFTSLNLIVNCTPLKTISIVLIVIDLKSLTKAVAWCSASSGLYKVARDYRLNP